MRFASVQQRGIEMTEFDRYEEELADYNTENEIIGSNEALDAVSRGRGEFSRWCWESGGWGKLEDAFPEVFRKLRGTTDMEERFFEYLSQL